MAAVVFQLGTFLTDAAAGIAWDGQRSNLLECHHEVLDDGQEDRGVNGRVPPSSGYFSSPGEWGAGHRRLASGHGHGLVGLGDRDRRSRGAIPGGRNHGVDVGEGLIRIAGDPGAADATRRRDAGGHGLILSCNRDRQSSSTRGPGAGRDSGERVRHGRAGDQHGRGGGRLGGEKTHESDIWIKRVTESDKRVTEADADKIKKEQFKD